MSFWFMMLVSILLCLLIPPIFVIIAKRIHRKENVNINLVKNWYPVENLQLTKSPLLKWGTYNPGIFSGLRTSTAPASISSNLVWFSDYPRSIVRYDAEKDDSIYFQWLRHNGINYGVQEIQDYTHELNILASHVISNNPNTESSISWIQRLEMSGKAGGKTKNILLVFGVDCDGILSIRDCVQQNKATNIHIQARTIEGINESYLITGYNAISGNFAMEVNICADLPESTSTILSYNGQPGRTIQTYVEETKSLTGILPISTSFVFDNIMDLEASAFVLNFSLTASKYTIDIIYHEGMEGIPSDKTKNKMTFETNSEYVSNMLQTHDEEFEREFQRKFPLLVKRTETSIDEGDNSVVHDYSSFHTEDIEAAKRILSGMLGGLGYFHGSPRLGNSPELTAEEESAAAAAASQGQQTAATSGSDVTSPAAKPLSLYSATPSRTAFPRGFLWDEGFHELLILRWNPAITMKVLSSWMNAMMTSVSKLGEHHPIGWIPREMILGADATRRVPEEFITQRVTIANPPTLLLVVEKLLLQIAPYCVAGEGSTDQAESQAILEFLRKIYPRLHVWIQGFLVTQKSTSVANKQLLFRWRGRSNRDNKFLPNTLASGLDDYPRSLEASIEESHLDLLCWMARSAQIMSSLQSTLFLAGNSSTTKSSITSDGVTLDEDYAFDYHTLAVELVSKLDTLHWSTNYTGYFDVGMHTEVAKQVTEVGVRCAADSSGAPYQDLGISLEAMQERPDNKGCPAALPVFVNMILDPSTGNQLVRQRRVPHDISLQHVPRVGYVCLFPLLLRLLSPDAETLPLVLDTLEDPEQIWSPYGLRSLSQNDTYYNRNNAPHDLPYWRGAIWININYLALEALKHYGLIKGPNQERCHNIYTRLRTNLLRTILGEFSRTGYIWEHYDDQTGSGMRGRPFTGWSALVVNIMTEVY